MAKGNRTFSYINDKDLRKRAKEIKALADQTYSDKKKVSPFLTPAEIEVAGPIIEQESCFYEDFGGYFGAERRRLVIYREEDLEIDEGDFDIVCFEIDQGKRSFSHPDILGSLISHGFLREEIGDILQSEDKSYVFLMEDMAYKSLSLDKIRNVSINIAESETGPEDILRNRQEKDISIASLRLDALVSGMCNLSRERAKRLIKQKKVKRNYIVEENPSKEVREGDVISISSYGRFSLKEVKGLSKKGKTWISFTHEI